MNDLQHMEDDLSCVVGDSGIAMENPDRLLDLKAATVGEAVGLVVGCIHLAAPPDLAGIERKSVGRFEKWPGAKQGRQVRVFVRLRDVPAAASVEVASKIVSGEIGGKNSSHSIEISYPDGSVTILRGEAAAKFMSRIRGLDGREAQHLMARVTGNFKRGNERA